MNTNEKRNEIINLLEKINLKVTDENRIIDLEGKEICNFIPYFRAKNFRWEI